MGGIINKDKRTIVVNNVIKSISKDLFGKQVVFDGANVIYKMFINWVNQKKKNG